MRRGDIIDDLFRFVIVLIFFIGFIFYLTGNMTNVYSLIPILVFILASLIIFIIYVAVKKKNFLRYKKTIEDLQRLTPYQFEDFIADLFCRLGYKTKKVGGSYDGGIDVIARKNGVNFYIQCKKFINRQVSVNDVRSFYGAMADKLSQSKGYFITTNIFTLESEKFAEGKPIELIDGKGLMNYIRLAGVGSSLKSINKTK